MRPLGAMVTLFAGAVTSACAGTPAAAPEEPPAVGEWVCVIGDVEKPGRVPVVRGRSPFTLLKALALSECQREPAVARIARAGSGETTVDCQAVLAGSTDDPELRPGDVVTVTARR